MLFTLLSVAIVVVHAQVIPNEEVEFEDFRIRSTSFLNHLTDMGFPNGKNGHSKILHKNQNTRNRKKPNLTIQKFSKNEKLRKQYKKDFTFGNLPDSPVEKWLDIFDDRGNVKAMHIGHPLARTAMRFKSQRATAHAVPWLLVMLLDAFNFALSLKNSIIKSVSDQTIKVHQNPLNETTSFKFFSKSNKNFTKLSHHRSSHMEMALKILAQRAKTRFRRSDKNFIFSHQNSSYRRSFNESGKRERLKRDDDDYDLLTIKGKSRDDYDEDGLQEFDPDSTVHHRPESAESRPATYVFIPTTYIGCFQKTHQISGDFSISGEDGMTVDACVYFCRDRRRTYAALHNGGDCACYSYMLYRDKALEERCDRECRGNEMQVCGGAGYMSVFTTCNLFFYGYSCIQPCFCGDGQCDFYTGLCPSERCRDSWKGFKCDRHFVLDASLAMVGWTSLIIYSAGVAAIIGFSWWTLLHMGILEANI